MGCLISFPVVGTHSAYSLGAPSLGHGLVCYVATDNWRGRLFHSLALARA